MTSTEFCTMHFSRLDQVQFAAMSAWTRLLENRKAQTIFPFAICGILLGVFLIWGINPAFMVLEGLLLVWFALTIIVYAPRIWGLFRKTKKGKLE